MQQDGGKHRTISGLNDGKKVTTDWTQCETTNAGKKNERLPDAQARFEIDAQYTKKTDKNWRHEVPTVKSSTYFEPMLAEKYAVKRLTFPVFSQPKLDGMRCIARKDGLWSRNGKPWNACPHIQEALAPFFEKFPDVVIDGEFYNHLLKDDFNEISSLVKKPKPEPEHLEKTRQIVQYHVYDFYDPNEPDSGFNHRFTKYSLNLWASLDGSGFVVCSETLVMLNEGEINHVYASYLADGYEGQMIRLGGSKYEFKRVHSLLKRKEFIDGEFIVVDIVEGLGNWSGCAKSITLRLPDGREFSSGIRGKQDYLAGVLANKDEYIGHFSTCRYQNLTPDGIPRFGVVTELKVEDK